MMMGISGNSTWNFVENCISFFHFPSYEVIYFNFRYFSFLSDGSCAFHSFLCTFVNFYVQIRAIAPPMRIYACLCLHSVILSAILKSGAAQTSVIKSHASNVHHWTKFSANFRSDPSASKGVGNK